MTQNKWVAELLPILALLAVIAVVIRRLPRVALGHTDAFRRRRFANWFPVGLTYSFLYFGRYNLNAAQLALGPTMPETAYATISGVGTIVYGFSFLLNGPLTDRWGGRVTILLAAGGTLVANVLMGLVLQLGWTSDLVTTFSVLYGLNMYFQSFGAVSIVKVNAPWFHVRERGTFGAIFGILISLGLYFAYDWGGLIAGRLPIQWVFYVPAALLAVLLAWDWIAVADSPAGAGLADFDTADASSGDDGPTLGPFAVARRMFASPVIVTIALVEFCSGFLRNAIMQWYKIFAKATGGRGDFVYQHWGMLLCVAGILGGVFAGSISDAVFQSRRGPVASVLYGGMLLGGLVTFVALGTPALGWTMVLMSLCIIGVHGMLSGTASMDFGGRKNAGVAVGIIDGMVYLGTALQFFVLGRVTPHDDVLKKDPANWLGWPSAMLPAALVGLLLAARLWNATPKSKATAAH